MSEEVGNSRHDKIMIYIGAALFVLFFDLLFVGFFRDMVFFPGDYREIIFLIVIIGLQIIVAVTSLAVGLRREEKFFKRALIISAVLNGALFIAFSVWIYVDAIFFCSTECGWAVLAIPGFFLLALVNFILLLIIALYLKYVKKNLAHVIIVVVMALFVVLLYLPTFVQSGCVRFDAVCMYDFLSEKSINENDPSICRKVPEYRIDDCYAEFARTNGDLTACELIERESGKKYCLIDVAGVTTEESICDGLDSYFRDLCFSKIAESMKDITICEKVSESGSVKNKKSCYQDVAVASKDPNICTEKVDANVYCYREVAVASRDLSICNQYFPSNDDTCERFVYEAIAVDNGGDLSVCDNLANLNARGDCKRGVAGKLNDEKLCEQAGGELAGAGSCL